MGGTVAEDILRDLALGPMVLSLARRQSRACEDGTLLDLEEVAFLTRVTIRYLEALRGIAAS